MATDARIALGGVVTDVGGELAQGQQTGERFRTAGIREQILDQTAQQGQQDIAQTQGAFMNQLATGLKSKPLDQRAAIVAQQLPFLSQLGINPAEIISSDLSDQGLDAVITQTRPFVQAQQVRQAGPTAGMQDFEFFQSVINDPNATPEAKQAARIKQGTEASTGRLQIKEVSPGVFQTFDANSGVTSDPFRRVNGKEVPLSRDEQLDLRLGEDVEGITTKGAATTDVEVTRAELLADVASAKKRGDLISDKQVNRLDNIVETGLSAVEALPSINRGMELLKTIKTGGATALSKVVTDFFGTTSGDIGELNNILAQNVLAGLSAFTGAISEGERAFLERMEANLSQGTAFNVAQLNRMRNIYTREVNKGLKAANLLGDQFSIDVFNDAINADAVGFGDNQSQVQSAATQQPPIVTTIDSAAGVVDADTYVDSLFNF